MSLGLSFAQAETICLQELKGPSVETLRNQRYLSEVMLALKSGQVLVGYGGRRDLLCDISHHNEFGRYLQRSEIDS